MKKYSGRTLEDLLAAAAADKGCDVSELSYVNVHEEMDSPDESPSMTADVFSQDDVKEFLFDYLGSFFTGIDQDLEVSIEEKNGAFIVRMNAENNAFLIGKMGKTLSAFNTIVRGAVNAEFHKRIDVLIDVNNYKEDRYAKLASMAKQIAKQVLNSHVDATLSPMPNDERKAIHQALNNWSHIMTQSEGEGRDRHICIRYVEDDQPSEDSQDPEEKADAE